MENIAGTISGNPSWNAVSVPLGPSWGSLADSDSFAAIPCKEGLIPLTGDKGALEIAIAKVLFGVNVRTGCGGQCHILLELYLLYHKP